MTDRKRVLHVIRHLKPYGAERIAVELCKLLRDRYEPAVVSFQGGALSDELRQLGLPVYGPEKPLRARPSVWAMFSRTREAIKAWDPAVVHTHMDYANIVGAWAARLDRVPSVAHIHGNEGCKYGQLVYRAAYRSIVSNATIVACGQGIADEFRRRTGLDPLVVHNGIGLSRFDASQPTDGRLRRELGIPSDSVLVGTVGRLDWKKDYPRLLRVAQRVTQRLGHVYFVAAGDGPLQDKLKDMKDEFGLSDRFRFLGFRSDVPQLLREFDIFVSTSPAEGLPLSVLEASASGCPVVATDVRGINEVVERGQTGFLISPDQEEKLATRIMELARHPQLRRRMGEAGRARVEQHFSLSMMVANIADLYGQSANRSRRSWRRAWL